MCAKKMEGKMFIKMIIYVFQNSVLEIIIDVK